MIDSRRWGLRSGGFQPPAGAGSSRYVGACLAMVMLLCSSLPARAGELQAGAATSNITPPLGQPIIGGFAPYPSTHVHDELHARCLVLDDGQTRLAIVVCDLLGLDRKLSSEARRLIEERLKIPPSHVLISGTHTHSASSALGKDRLKMDVPLDDYQAFVAQRIADGVQRAVNSLRPAEIGFTTAEAAEHVFNRRWYMKPGTVPENPFGGIDQVKMNPPAGSPNLTEPAGPTDPTVSIIAVREPEGKPISVFAAYSLHYVGGVKGADISADYFGMFSERLKQLVDAEHQDPPFVAMMANGTSGDINNINFRTPRPRKEPYEQMRHVAHDVAAKVHAALDKVTYRRDVRLDARYREPTLRWRRPTEEQIAWAKETKAAGPKVPGRTDLSVIYAERALSLAEYPETTTVPLQVLAIGDIGIGTMPCEVFCEIGLEFKERSPLRPGFMVSLNHGYFGYLPSPRHHRLGGYETWLGTNRLETEASDKLLAELFDMASEIRERPAVESAAVPLEPEVREKALAVLRAGLASDQFWPAMHAAEGLTVAGKGKEVLAALAKRTAADDQQACGLAREAVRAGDKSKVVAMLEILAKPGSSGHTHAAESLFKVAKIRGSAALDAALSQDEDLKLKLMAAAAITRGREWSTLEFVRPYLTHEDRETRKIAAWILGQIGTQADVPALRQALAAEEEPLARCYLANALACLGDAEGRRLLGENLQSSDPIVRTYSADFAGHARAVEHRDALVKLLDDENLDTRIRAAQSLFMLAHSTAP
jgi:neutral ceramidase